MPSEFLRLKKQMPKLGVGLGLRGHFSSEVFQHRKQIDFLEFTPENYGDNIVATNWLARFADYFPMVSHSVSLSIGGLDPLSADLLKMERRFAAMFGLHWWSDHLCFTGFDGESSHDLLPLPWTEQAVKHVAARIREAQERVGKPLAIENIPFYTKMPAGNFDEAEFISRVLEEADCGLLLDLNNLQVNSINHKFDPIAFLDRLPLERVLQIHLAGHGQYGKRIVDTHGAAVSDGVMDMLAHVLKKAPDVNSIMIERDQFFPEFSELLGELDRVRNILVSAAPNYFDGNSDIATGGGAGSDVGVSLLAIPPQLIAEQALVEADSADAVSADSDSSGMGSADPDSDVSDSAEDNAVLTWERRQPAGFDIPSSSETFKSRRAAGAPRLEPGAAESNSAESDPELSSTYGAAKTVPDLEQYQREWFSLWKETKGKAPEVVDGKKFRPSFSRRPAQIDGYDVRAISIYAWLRDSNRDFLMRSVFPTTFMLLRSKWKKILENYFYEFRHCFPQLRDIGNDFPKFMDSYYSALNDEYPFLPELIRYEMLRWSVGQRHELTAATSEVYVGATEQIKNCMPIVNPEMTIAYFRYPVEQMSSTESIEDLLKVAGGQNPGSAGSLPDSGSSISVDVPVEPSPYAIMPHEFHSRVLAISPLAAHLVEKARRCELSYSQLIASLMTPEQQKSSTEIAGFIRMIQRLHEEKVLLKCVPRDGSSNWQQYVNAVESSESHRTVQIALSSFVGDGQDKGIAVDMGCGSGRDTRFLLGRGWTVFAVDSSSESLRSLEKAVLANSAEAFERLVSVHADMLEGEFVEQADLVNAALSLPFCGVEKFKEVWNRICQTIREGGRFSGHFFGIHDDWAVDTRLIFHDKAQVAALFDGFEIEFFQEYEGPMPVVGAADKHGHLFEVVARKLG